MRSITGLSFYVVFALAQIAFSHNVSATPQFAGPSIAKEFATLDANALPGGYQIWSDNSSTASNNASISFYYATGLFVGDGIDAALNTTSSSTSNTTPPLQMAAPDPTTIALLGVGLICLGLARRKRKKNQHKQKSFH